MKAMNQKGFTLIELMMVIAIAAILLAVAVPEFTSLMRKNELRAEFSKIHSTLAFARSEAVARNEHVAICSSSNGLECNGSDDWVDGWIVFVDRDESGTLTEAGDCEVAGCDARLKVQNGLDGTVSLKGATSIAFSDKGDLASLATQVLRLCAGDALELNDVDHSRTISVSVSGSIRVKKGASTCQ